ncbi:MAG: hypothetical protein OEU36_10480 [Gammaproteobacteria bacterium]|nr:hypothetical protein [Gammaproteobacteria bacterium]
MTTKEQLVWEMEQDGQWSPVPVEQLPESVRSKKSVRFAFKGGVLKVAGTDRVVRSYRLRRVPTCPALTDFDPEA